MTMAMLGIAIVSCTPHSPEDPGKTDSPQEEIPDIPQDETPEEELFKIKVYDISAVSATVEVEPLDPDSPYYIDIIDDSDFQQATKYGFDDYMSWLLETLENQTGQSRKEVVEMISSYGNDGFIHTTLTPETRYHAFAVGIGEDGMTTTEVYSIAFDTLEEVYSDNILTITPEVSSATHASIGIEASNDDTYLFTVESADAVEGMSDKQLADYIIQSNIAWGGLEQMTYSGSQDIEWEGKAGWDYVAVAFGYSNGSVTTEISKTGFSMLEGGDPDACDFEFGYDFDSFQMHLTITPSDNSVVYISNYIEKTDMEILEIESGSREKALAECLDLLIEDMIEDCGSRARVIDLISVMGEQTFSIRFKPSTEYIQWAVPVNQNGTPIGNFRCSEVFRSPEEVISDASLTLKSHTCYNGSELAELYPATFKNAKGYAVVELVVEPSESAVQWWSYVALEDLTDRSREVIIKNLVNAPTEPNLTRQFVIAYWGVNTIMGVAQDKDGTYGPLMLEVVDLKKEEAASASDLEL